MAAAGLGVLGAFYGFAGAACIIMLVAVVYVRRFLKPGERSRQLYGFAVKVMLYTLVFNLIFKLDAVCVKPIAAGLFENVMSFYPNLGEVSSWLMQTAVQIEADSIMADYGMAVNVSRLPWQATIAITFVIFPMVSEATFAQDVERTRLYIRQTFRYSTILVAAAVVVLMAMPDAIFRILPKGYESGAIALTWLAPAYFSFSLFNIVNTLLMSAGRAGQALIVGLITVILILGFFFGLQYYAEEILHSSADLLRYASIGTFTAFTIGLLLGVHSLWRLYGPPIPVATVLRVILIGAVITSAGRMLPEMGRITSLAVAALAGILFLVGLALAQEFNTEDKQRFLRVIKRRRS